MFKVNDLCSDPFRIMKEVRQGCPLFSNFLFNLFINDIFKDCEKYGVPLGNFFWCGGLFVDDIVLCSPSRTKLKKAIKRKLIIGLFIMKWNLVLKKCATMVIRPNTPTL